MRVRGTSKTKESKFNATVGLIVGIGMLAVALMAFNIFEMPAFGKVFMIFWIGAACANIYQSFRNSIFSKDSLHHEVTDHELTASGMTRGAYQSTPQKSHAQRLRELEQIYHEGLLTTAEYEAKRKDILDEDWGK